MKKRILSLVLAAVMIFSCLPSAFAVENDTPVTSFSNGDPLTLGNTSVQNPDAESGLAPAESSDSYDEDALTDGTEPLEKFESQGNTPFSETEAAYKPAADEVVTFIVELETKPLLAAGYSTSEIAAQSVGVRAYQSKQETSIQTVQTTLKNTFGKDESFSLGYTYTIGMTGMAVRTEFGNKDAIKAIKGVKNVYVAPTYSIPDDTAASTVGTLEPLTANATTMVGANVLNESGYTGKGMKIAILDTGILLDHPNFQALPEDALTEDSMTRESVDAIWKTLNASQMTNMLNLSYYNTKIPFIFNYFWGNFDVSHTGTANHDHGTHVAGIAAGNKIDTSTAVGVAPDAQLVVMQVFSNTGGAGWDTIMAALEDCVRLEVDAVNLSLGAAAGFVDHDGDMLDVLELYKKTDIQVLIASGNDANSAYMNETGLDMALSSNPDIGLTSTPGTYSAALSVASVDNDGSYKLYFTVGDKQIGFSDTASSSATSFITNLAGQELTYVAVPGVGTEDDFAQVDVEGKVALISRGTISFPEKQANAQTAGAIACVIYNNVAGDFLMQINDGEGNIPCVSISKADGQYMIGQDTKTLTVCNAADMILVKSDRAISSFSSWGVTPDLKLKPEIAGVGGQVYSSTDPAISGSYYATWDGTSMATPQVTGAAAVLTEYFQENYPEITGTQLRQVVANLMMSTADPVMTGDLEYSPRAQGAGLVNLVDATTSPAYLSNSDASEGRPKAEFGDDPEKTGVYEFSFQINNLNSDKELSYKLDASVFTETLYYYFIANTPYALGADVSFYGPVNGTVLKYDFNDDGVITTADARILLRDVTGSETVAESDQHYAYRDVNGDGAVDKADVDVITAYCAGLDVAVDMLATFEGTVSGETDTVTVPAGETVNVDVVITLSGDDKTYMDQFENGIYVEGFVYALSNDEGGVDLQLPFVGFYGDWSDAPVLDSDPATSTTGYPFLIYTDYAQVGYNPYLRDGASGDQYNAFSYNNLLAEIDFGQLRNAKRLLFTVTDSVTGEQYFELEGFDLTKTYYSSSYGMVIPTYVQSYYGEVWDGTDANGKQLPNGTVVDYKVEAWLDDGDDVMDDAYSFSITLDSKAPVIVNEFDLQKSVSIVDGRVYLELEMQDEHYIAALIFQSADGAIMGKYAVDNVPGQTVKCEYDITGFGSNFTIILADYACNENEIDVSLDLGDYGNDAVLQQLDKDRLYGCETFDGALVEAGWFSADKYDFSDPRNETYDSTNRYYSAEYVNGYLIAQSAVTGDLELITPSGSYWGSKTLLKNNGSIGDPNVWVLYDMALDYSDVGSSIYDPLGDTNGTDTLYAVGWMYQGDNDNDGHDDGYNALFRIWISRWNGNFFVDEIGRISGTDGELLTLVCNLEGELYGIDTTGKFYSVDPQYRWDGNVGANVIDCTYIGTTDFVNVENYSGANVIQSMGFDHNDETLYWYAHSQTASGYSYINVCMTYIVDPETGKCTEEVGTYGPGGQTCLFVPHDIESDLFTIGVNPTSVYLEPYQLTLAQGQTVRLKPTWSPWNAAPQEVVWTSADESIATVSASGIVTAVSEGEVYISGKTQIWNEWRYDENRNSIGAGWEERNLECVVTVVPSQDSLYGYVVSDYGNVENNFSWVTYGDQEPGDVTVIGKQYLTSTNPFTGEETTSEALWQGGTYYNGYVYAVVVDTMVDETGAVGNASVLYRSKVTEGRKSTKTTIGEPERIGGTMGVEVGNIGFDYNTGRMYGVDLTNGGLCIIDLDTGSVDCMGVFSGEIGGAAIATAMCVTADGTIVIADMSGNLYTVDPDSLSTTKIGSAGSEYWFYGAMTYDYNTGNIYWNPCMSQRQSPLYMVILEANQWDPSRLETTLVDLGDVSSKSGTEQTVIFTVPENEPETKSIPVEAIEIANGESVTGLEGGQLRLTAVTTPARPTVQAKTWTSSDESVVTVDRFGVLTYKGVGTATVTVSITNKDEATYGGPFTDSIQVTVLEAAGRLEAFLNSDEGGTGYYDFWISVNDYDLSHASVGESMISIYSLRTGTYYDGYYYAYTEKGEFLRIDAENPADYKILGKLNRDTSIYQVTGMAFDYTTGTMYGLTLCADYNATTWSSVKQVGELVTIDLDTGAVTAVGELNFNAPVFALACDASGQLYAAGGYMDSYTSDTIIYKMDKTTAAQTEYVTIQGAGVYTGYNYYGTQYNAQMTYDFGTDRLYLNATTDHQYWSTYSGMYMVQLGDEPAVTSLGGISLYTRSGSDVKYGNVYLGLLASIPEDDEVPVGKVNGIILNKTAGRVAVGETAQLIAQVRPSNAADPSVTWKSSNDAIATVDENGLVTGVAAGTADITVTSNETGVSTVCQITVVDLTGPQSTAYTISAQKDALISFNPELPAQTAEVVATVSGGSSIKGMAYGDNCLYYLVYSNYSNYLYRFDFTTNQSTAMGQLYTFNEPSGLAYDAVNNLIYVTGGFYLFQFQADTLDPAGFNHYSNYMMDNDYCTLSGVACVNGAVYTIGNDYYTSASKLMKYSDKYLHDRTVLLDGFDVNVVAGATDFAYDSSAELFYLTDAGHNIYSMDMNGNVTLVDLLGDGIDLNGLAIAPAAKEG